MQRMIRSSTIAAAAGALVVAMPLAATAHHGWSWTENGFFKLEGTVETVTIGNPHATMDVEVNGEIWRVEMAPPSRTIRAGITEDIIEAGDEITAIGNRSQDESERRMKAVRIIVDGKSYDVYPARAADIDG